MIVNTFRLLKKIILLSTIYFLFFSCNENKESEKEHAGYVIVMKKLKGMGDSQYTFDEVTFVPLETKDIGILAQADKVICHNGDFYVLDTNNSSLKVFDAGGKYLRSIGGLGRGPGEFTTLWDFDLDTETNKLLLLSNNEKSIFEYDTDGNFIQKKDIGLFASLFANEKEAWYYYLDNNTNELSGDYNLIATDGEGKVKSRLFPANKGMSMSANEGILSKGEKGILYSSALSDTVFRIVGSDGLYPKYIFDFGEETLPKKARVSDEEFMKAAKEHSFLQRSLIDTGEFLFFSFKEKDKGFAKTAFCYLDENPKIAKDVPTPIALDFPLDGPPIGIGGNNGIISYIDVARLLNWIGANEENLETIKKNYPELYNLIPSLKRTDNPILVIFKIKIQDVVDEETKKL